MKEELQEPIFSVLYASSAVELFSEAELLELLRVSRRNNSRDSVTGILLYHDGNFMQVLEGPENSVGNVLTRVGRDPRHRGMLTLLTQQLSVRDFPDWSMGFRDLSKAPPEELEGFNSFLRTSQMDDAFKTDPRRCYKMLHRFKQSAGLQKF